VPLNVKNIAGLKELVSTTGVESQRAMDDADGFTAKALQTKDNSLYASNFGASVGRYYDYALSSAGTSYGNAKVGDVGLSYNANSNSPFGANANLVSNENVNFYAQSNAEFSNLDKEKGANNEVGRWIGSKVGSAVGGTGGAAVGAVVCSAGALVCSSALGTAGAVAGGKLGGKIGDKAGDFVAEKFKDGYDYVADKFVDGYDYVAEKLEDGYDFVAGKFTDGYDYVADTAKNAYQKTKDLFGWESEETKKTGAIGDGFGANASNDRVIADGIPFDDGAENLLTNGMPTFRQNVGDNVFYVKSRDDGSFDLPDVNSDKFEKLKGGKIYRKKDDGSIWEKDKLHKNHWEVYKDKKNYEKGKREMDVWDDGRLKGYK